MGWTMTIPSRALGSLAALALASALAGGAAAQDLDWSGFYVGAHTGHGWGTANDRNNTTNQKSLDGFFGGLNGGYNYQLEGGLVLGLEADASVGNIREHWSGLKVSPSNPYYSRDEVAYLGSFRARVGYAQGNFLPYITGGLAWAETRHKVGCDAARSSTPVGCATKFQDSDKDFNLGWTVGAGVEYAADENWIIKAEYLYTDLGESDVTLHDPNGLASDSRSFDMRVNTVRLGVTYKF